MHIIQPNGLSVIFSLFIADVTNMVVRIDCVRLSLTNIQYGTTYSYFNSFEIVDITLIMNHFIFVSILLK